MSQTGYIDITFVAEFELENISKLLQSPIDYGFFYYHINQLASREIYQLSMQECIDILLGKPNKWMEDDYENYIEMKYQDIVFNVHLHKSQTNNILLGFTLSSMNKKAYWYNVGWLDYPDFARCIRLLLETYKHHKIIELKTDIF